MKAPAKTFVCTVLIVISAFLFCLAGCTFQTNNSDINEKPVSDPESGISDNSQEQNGEKSDISDFSPKPESEKPDSYITPEQYGAEGNGTADDTEAFEKCMNSTEKYILLSGQYRITGNIEAEYEKHFYAISDNGETGASIICEPVGDYKTLTFKGGVTFENIEFLSTRMTTGRSPHGETYRRTSNVVFTEVWNKTGTFTNCTFTNALIAIRGRKTTESTVIPENITVRNCRFNECKIPIQGYCENTFVADSTFLNDGDLYGGDHCVYIERYGCRSLIVSGCRVETTNCESGHAFQIYGDPMPTDVIPELTIENCDIYANGITSSSAANVTVSNCVFFEQRSEQFILIAESGTVTVRDCEFHHAYAFSYADSSVKPYAENCIFDRLPSLGYSRCNFPQESVNCTYINWGGNVRVPDTKFTDCTFSRTEKDTLDSLYINNTQGYSIYLKNTRFQSGDTITNNEKAIKETTGVSVFN